jgi:hypothetical protein
MTDVFPQAWEGPATGPGSLALLPAAEVGAAKVKNIEKFKAIIKRNCKSV